MCIFDSGFIGFVVGFVLMRNFMFFIVLFLFFEVFMLVDYIFVMIFFWDCV